jgi:hypothetical protein
LSIPIHVDGASPVGLSEIADQKWTIYPNPAASVVHLEGPEISTQHWFVTDPAGRLIPVPVLNESKEKITWTFLVGSGSLFYSAYKRGRQKGMKLISRIELIV